MDRGREGLDRGSDSLDRGRDSLEGGRDSFDRGSDSLDRGSDSLDRAEEKQMLLFLSFFFHSMMPKRKDSDVNVSLQQKNPNQKPLEWRITEAHRI
uniref:Uncharacterized protein n=1 Tax=Oryzias latipes TaxID=8090 RepID=A0A3B3HY31_ORYLA